MEIDIISAQFDSQQTNRYSLWMRFGSRECAFTILDNSTKQFVRIRKIGQIPFSKTIDLFKELSFIPFSNVTIALESQFPVVVPSSLYQPAKKYEFIAFNTDISMGHEVMEHVLPSLSLVQLFTLAPSLKTVVASYFPQARLVHATSSVLVAMQLLSRINKQQTIMGVLLTENNVHLCLFESGKLLFFNSFLTKTKEDIAYWVLRLFDQFDLNTTQVQLYLQGIDNSLDDRILILKQYISKVQLLPFPSSCKLASDLRSEQLQSFTDLFYMPLCEL